MKKSVIWFDFDSDKPKLQPADVVDRIAQVLLDHPEQLVLVYGHASKEGTMEYNQNLSERRARAIVRLLKLKGVPSDQIVSKGFSYTQQYDDSENPYHDIALDRRVEIIPVFEKDRISE
jgi:outer membrane protein OmpA-like peptidoglycan-associated protein